MFPNLLISFIDALKAGLNIEETTRNFHSFRAIRERDNAKSSPQYSGKSDASEFPLFDFNSILVATENFSIENKLGQGGFGSVYKVIVFLFRVLLFFFL